MAVMDVMVMLALPDILAAMSLLKLFLMRQNTRGLITLALFGKEILAASYEYTAKAIYI